MSKLHRYFETKIGNRLSFRVTTGERFFTKVYARQYRMEVVSVSPETVSLLVSSYDLCPSGVRNGNTTQGFGTITVPLHETVEATLHAAALQADGAFFKTYPQPQTMVT